MYDIEDAVARARCWFPEYERTMEKTEVAIREGRITTLFWLLTLGWETEREKRNGYLLLDSRNLDLPS